jgi:hypothetical protein
MPIVLSLLIALAQVSVGGPTQVQNPAYPVEDPNSAEEYKPRTLGQANVGTS